MNAKNVVEIDICSIKCPIGVSVVGSTSTYELTLVFFAEHPRDGPLVVLSSPPTIDDPC